MNTPTAYASRARTARDAAQALAAQGGPFSRQDDERAARLADYAGRCSDLAAAASGSRVTAPELRAIGHADATSAAWIDIRHTRERAGMYRH